MVKKAAKVFMSVLLLTMLFGVFSQTAEICADENEFDTVLTPLDSTDGLNLASYSEEAERLLKLGQRISSMRYNSILGLNGVPNLKQSDSRWSSAVMQECGKTIGNAGCCLTGFTDIQQYYGGTDTPDIVNSRLGNAACPFKYYSAEAEYNYTVSLLLMQTVSYADTLNYVKAAISEGHPVLIGMAHETKGTHFVVAFAYAYDNIIIRDPASRDYTYLGDYINDGYWVNRICIFEN